MIALECRYLFDGTDGELVENGIVLVDGDRVAAAGPSGAVAVPPEAEVIELGEHTVLPGLIDAHTHLFQIGETLIYSGETPAAGDLALQAARNVRRDLRSGVTTMRVLGEQDFNDVPVRRAIENGTVPGPRLLLATRAIHATNGHGFGRGYDGPHEIRRAVRENLRAGADVIKMMATGSVDLRGGHFSQEYTREEMATVVEEAHRVGKKVAAHAIRPPEVIACLETGVNTIEHGHMIDDRCIELLLEKDAWLVGTLAIVLDEHILAADMEANPKFADVEWLPRRRAAPAAYRRAIEAGVRYASGTDAMHGALPKELEDLVGIGIPEPKALLSATRDAADALDILPLTGTLEPGKQADVVAVRGNPLDDIKALRDVEVIMKSGRRYDHLSPE